MYLFSATGRISHRLTSIFLLQLWYFSISVQAKSTGAEPTRAFDQKINPNNSLLMDTFVILTWKKLFSLQHYIAHIFEQNTKVFLYIFKSYIVYGKDLLCLVFCLLNSKRLVVVMWDGITSSAIQLQHVFSCLPPRPKCVGDGDICTRNATHKRVL